MSEKLIENSKKDKFRKFGGITLISLVITILILIILAGVAIYLGIGQNGIIERAKQASNKMKETQSEEEMGVNILSSQMTNIIETDAHSNNRIPSDIDDGSKKYNIEKIGKLTLSVSGANYSITYEGENKELLTSDNFIVEIVSYYNSSNSVSVKSYNWNLSKEYDPTTGIISVSRGSIPGASANIVVNIWVYY